MNSLITLNGKWRLRWSDGERGGQLRHLADIQTDSAKWIEANVPGEVHLDLVNAGLIQNPYIGTNCLSARWVEECYWSYRKTFTPPPVAFKGAAWLCFEGLDYYATIFLNGELVGKHSNFFCPCRINVTGKLRRGENVLVVQLDGGLFGVSEKPVKGYYGCDRINVLLHKRIWLRKPQCSFGWDWSTRLINVGIHKPVALEWADNVRLDQLVVLADLNADFTEGTLQVKMFAEGIRDEKQQGELMVRIVETKQEFSKKMEVVKGMQFLEAKCAVPAPRLWWPVGQGNQPLYNVRVGLKINGRIIGEKTVKIGFRKIRINQDPHPDGGRYFIIEVNGKKVFAKGANFVPADMIFANIDRKRYETIIDRALEANFNMLRVWGGGLYESDDFYELCDEKGIMVWQEFIFACAAYPTTDEDFMRNVKAEAVYNVRRLAVHPSLVVWCGNNEQQWHTYNQEEGVIYPDYALYHYVLPRILKQEDPAKYYLPSSPMSPDYAYPNNNDVGDQHPWDVGFDNVDFRDYRKMICRFPNEGGFPGPVSIKTMHACLPDGQKHLNSFAWQIHDNGVEQWYPYSALDRTVSNWLKLDPRKMSIEDFTYYGGLVQGEGLREYIDNFRRRKYDSASAIFWMFNDCWPVTRSWTIVDYYLRRNPAFYPVKRAFAPVSVVVTREHDTVKIYGINDSTENWNGELQYGLFTLAGKYTLNELKNVRLESNTSNRIASFSAKTWDRIGIKKSIAFAQLVRGGRIIARNRLFLPQFHEMKWPKTEVGVKRAGDYAVFLSKMFVWGVCIGLDGEKVLPDNFFDIWPGMKYEIPWPEDKKLPVIVRTGNLCL